jgi:hypothetical protein
LALSATIVGDVLQVSQDATAEDDALTIEFDADLFSSGGVRLTAATLGGGSPQVFDAAGFDSIAVNTGSDTGDTVDIPSSDPFTGPGSLDDFHISTGQVDIHEDVEVGTSLSLILHSSAQSNIVGSISGAGDFIVDAVGTVRLQAAHV